ncbi:MAG: low molecular weight phosphotyrosine protein phosphatase [Cocleimonas sp.]|nr:low molecular weight phosphotyrosine protein phosphatase [Cocleimonas sp.]
MIVCVGNICRSPMAEVLLKHKKPVLNVYSSGLGALVGYPADPISIELMRQKNIRLDEHKAQQIDPSLVFQSDLILAMEKKHVHAIQAQFPEARGKVFLIGKWADEQEIPDPYRKGNDAFELALSLIETGVEDWLKKI